VKPCTVILGTLCLELVRSIGNLFCFEKISVLVYFLSLYSSQIIDSQFLAEHQNQKMVLKTFGLLVSMHWQGIYICTKSHLR